MQNDFRNTKYCPALCEITAKKEAVDGMVKKDHPKARDMHHYISKNGLPYKAEFMKAYNSKCAYCGASTQVLPMRMFEIDHFFTKNLLDFIQKLMQDILKILFSHVKLVTGKN